MSRLRRVIAAVTAGISVSVLSSPDVVAQTADPGERPLWLRNTAVSPDGGRIAFNYGGQIWVVASKGGQAVPLTGPNAYSKHAVWSPDGKRIAFASTVHGNLDVFVMSSRGGGLRRLTHHSTGDVPYAFTPDGKSVLFASIRLGRVDVPFYLALPFFSRQIYTVPVEGGRPRIEIPTPAIDVRPNSDGTLWLYTSLTSIEQNWRKHARSDATREIWLFDTRTRKHRRLTSFRGEDRSAAWAPDGRSFYYVSDRSGSMNVWRRPLLPALGKPVQVTFHEKHPVRSLTSARDGSLVYSYNGEIWRLAAGASKPERVDVRIARTRAPDNRIFVSLRREATEIVVSPTGLEVAIVVRGDVFVVSTTSGKSRRITSTPQEERWVSFSPDGRKLIYAAERDGDWDLYETRIARKDDLLFFNAALLEERRVVNTKTDLQQPRYAPDGRVVAYLENRTALKATLLETGKTMTLLPGDRVYSYSDGDISFDWSPDGRWIVIQGGRDIGNPDILLIDATGRNPPHNLSRNGFSDIVPSFSPRGNAILWLSDRRGLRSAINNPAQFDVFAAYLTKKAFATARLSPEAFTVRLLRQREMRRRTKKPIQPIVIEPELDGIKRRTRRLTPFSLSPLFYKLTPSGETLIVIAEQEGDGVVGYAIDLRRRKLRQIFSGLPASSAAFATDRRMAYLYFFTAAGLGKFHFRTRRVTNIPFAAQLAYDRSGERRYIFDHAGRIMQQKFYRADMGGVDWAFYRRAYARFLPHINNWRDLAEMMSEMAGELNASHTGANYSPPSGWGDRTASLGLFYDDRHTGPGMKISGVLSGGPADQPGSALRPGATIVAVNRVRIGRNAGIHRYLNRRAKTPLTLTIVPGGSNKTVEEVVTPVSMDRAFRLAYRHWVRGRQEIARKMSAGRVAYVHIPAMELSDYQRLFGEMFGVDEDAEAIVIDVRFNLGGNLHSRLVALTTGRLLARIVTRDALRVGRVPNHRWTRPSAVLANASSYSDGMVFPFLFKEAKIGPVVGSRVPGTGTMVWWQKQLERRLSWGIPQLGMKALNGHYLEGQELVPDILVYNGPNAVSAGRDPQLEAAVKALLKKLPPNPPVKKR